MKTAPQIAVPVPSAYSTKLTNAAYRRGFDAGYRLTGEANPYTTFANFTRPAKWAWTDGYADGERKARREALIP